MWGEESWNTWEDAYTQARAVGDGKADHEREVGARKEKAHWRETISELLIKIFCYKNISFVEICTLTFYYY